MPAKVWAFCTILLAAYICVPYKLIDPNVRPFYNAYMKEVHANCHYPQYYTPGQTIIKLTKLTAGEKVCDESGKCVDRVNVGNCVKRLNRIEIEFDRETWATLTNSDKYKFLSHEMSHCILGLEHTNDRDDLMYPVHISVDQKTAEAEVEKAIKSVCR